MLYYALVLTTLLFMLFSAQQAELAAAKAELQVLQAQVQADVSLH
jgi:hypothetical protein